MFLVRLVYASRVSGNFKQGDIESILAAARRNNSKSCVTGLLCFNQEFFLQCLEGSRSQVNKTYHNILNDPRHSDIVMLDYKEINQRDFSEWHMGYVPTSSLTHDINTRFSGTEHFDPYEMSGESARQMMVALRDVVPTV